MVELSIKKPVMIYPFVAVLPALDDIMDIDIGEELVQVTKQPNGSFKVTNAMNGRGDNTFSEHANTVVSVL